MHKFTCLLKNFFFIIVSHNREYYTLKNKQTQQIRKIHLLKMAKKDGIVVCNLVFGAIFMLILIISFTELIIPSVEAENTWVGECNITRVVSHRTTGGG